MAAYDWQERVIANNANLLVSECDKGRGSPPCGFVEGKFIPFKYSDGIENFNEFVLSSITLAAEAGCAPRSVKGLFATEEDLEVFCEQLEYSPYRVVNDRISEALSHVLPGYEEIDQDGIAFSNKSVADWFRICFHEDSE